MTIETKRVFRIGALAILALFAAQLAEGRPANQTEAGGARPAQAVPQRPAQRPAPTAKPQTEAPRAEGADEQQAQSDAEMQEQLMDAMRTQFTQEALGRIRYGTNSNYNWFDRFMSDFLPFLVFLVVTSALIWILRTILDNRRWNKMVKVQTETHAKLLDRFGASQELLAYMQSEAGKKFLETPIFEGQRKQVSTLPFGRILWSVQIGIVAGFLGAGFLFLRGKATPDADMGFQIFGTLVLTLGIGFLVSGGVSYLLAKYFGLLERHDELARAEHGQ